MKLLGYFTHLVSWKALLVIVVLGAVGIFAQGFKFVKILAWALVALVAVCASWNEVKG
jgi:hypothetical protein